MRNIPEIAFAVAFGIAASVVNVSTAQAASFNCDAKGLKADEKAICANRDLNDLDVKMATQFDWLAGMFAMGMRGVLQDEQTAWLETRAACKDDKACIRNTYKARLKTFDDYYNKLERPAPMQ